MTYKELYNEWINEVWASDIDGLPSWVTGGKEPAQIMEDNDPIMYRCGFADWLDGTSDQDIQCDSCTNTVDSHHIVNDCDMDDEVECQVCAGTHFECEGCNELFEVDEMYKDSGMCLTCYEEGV